MLREAYFAVLRDRLAEIERAEGSSVQSAARLISRSIRSGGIVHAFGPGHSSLLAREITSRAGGLVPINQIVDHTEGAAERLSGYAEALLQAYESQYELRQDECVIVISNSGINPLPIEIALLAHQRGLKTIALTNRSQSETSKSRHGTGKRLFEVVDVVLDNHGVPGDATVDIPGTNLRSGACSTVLGAFLLNSLVLTVIEDLNSHDYVPPILVSQNLPGADDRNRDLLTAYRSRLRRPGA